MLKKSLPIVLILTFLLAACSPAAATNTYPAPGDSAYPLPEATQPPVESENTTGLNPDVYPAPGVPTVYDPLPDDAKLTRSTVEIVAGSTQIFLEASPIVYVRMTVQVSDLCQVVRVMVNPPQAGKVNLEVYSVADTSQVCAQVVNLVVPTVTLGTLQPGSYELLINGVSAGSFEVK